METPQPTIRVRMVRPATMSQRPKEHTKIPQIPITLMNSTLLNKEIQLAILCRSKKAMLQDGKPSSEQDHAVREILDTYQTQFNFRDPRKKRQLEELKAGYMRDLFAKNLKKPPSPRHVLSCTSMPVKRERNHNQSSSVLACCPGFCEYINQLQHKKLYSMTQYI